MINDLRYAVRVLLRSRLWTLTVVTLLAAGIGANTVIFAAANGALLRAVPVKDPESLVRLAWVGENDMGTDLSDYGYSEKIDGQRTSRTFSYPVYEQFRASNQTLVDLIACAPQGQVNVIAQGEGQLASAFVASGNYFDMLGVPALIGRTFTPEDDRPEAPPVAVIGYGYWMRRFGGQRSAIGSLLQIGTARVTVIGVTPQAFTGVQRPIAQAPDITLPLSVEAEFDRDSQDGSPPRLRQGTNWWLQVMGRLRPHTTPAQVEGNLDGVFQAAAREGWSSYFASLSSKEQALSGNQKRHKVPHLKVQPGRQGFYDASPDLYRTIGLLSTVVSLVLLLVCANVANLLLARATARRREFSVRMAMGAPRWRLARSVLTESLLLGLLSAAGGLLVGYCARKLLPDNLSNAAVISWHIPLFVGVLAIASGVAIGLAPALRSSRLTAGDMLKAGSATVTGGGIRLGKVMVSVQVAISLALIVGAGLFLRTIRNLRHVEFGFDTGNLLLVPVNPSLNRYPQPRIEALFGQLLDELHHVPGVRAATASRPAPLSGHVNGTSIFIQGRSKPGDENQLNRMIVVPNFFDTMGIGVMSGRAFTTRDTRTSPKVAIINQAAARKFFRDQTPLGQRIGTGFESSGEMEIVGVVADAKYNSVRDTAPPTLYVPYTQSRLDYITFELRTAIDPRGTVAAVRNVVRKLDPALPVLNVMTETEQIELRFAQEKMFAQACTLFAGLALVIASVGLFALLSYNVARRRNEIGIRMAVGAKPNDIVSMILREALALVALGIVAGAAISVGAGRLLSSSLFNLNPYDPATIAAAAALMFSCALVAGLLPARNAARTDPMIAMRDH